MSLGIYVHWPYCARICPYCDFNVYRARGRDEAPLLDAIIADLRGHREKIGPRVAETLFLGGGTPSLLSARGIERLITAARNLFALADGAEITIEANPDDRARFADFVAAGVNRLSVGVQALRDEALQTLGRTHEAQAGIGAVEAAARTGARVSLDLIYARPQQTSAAWRAELREAFALPAEHFSLYQLTIEERTAFGSAAARGDLVVPDAECAADLYEATQEECERAGAVAYEISNHARSEGARARHNLIYWRGGDWIGVGPGAHGRIEYAGRRWAVEAHEVPAGYIDAVRGVGLGWKACEPMSGQAVAEERLAMGLRISEGVAREDIECVLDRAKLRALEESALVRTTQTRVALTPRGRLVADRVAAELLQ